LNPFTDHKGIFLFAATEWFNPIGASRSCMHMPHPEFSMAVSFFLEFGIYIKHIPAYVSIDTYICSKSQSTQQQASEQDKTE